MMASMSGLNAPSSDFWRCHSTTDFEGGPFSNSFDDPLGGIGRFGGVDEPALAPSLFWGAPLLPKKLDSLESWLSRGLTAGSDGGTSFFGGSTVGIDIDPTDRFTCALTAAKSACF